MDFGSNLFRIYWRADHKIKNVLEWTNENESKTEWDFFTPEPKTK